MGTDGVNDKVQQNANFATRVRQVCDGQRNSPQRVALGDGRGTGVRRSRDPARTTALEPRRNRGRSHRRRGQGYGSQALRIGFSCSRSPQLAAGHVACLAHSSSGRDARLCRPRSLAPDWRPETRGGGDGRRFFAHRHASARILRWRPALSGGQDAAVSRPADRPADLQGVRCLRSGAARVARRHFRQIRRGDRPRREAALRCLSFYSGGRPDSGVARYLLAGQEWLGQPGEVPGHGASHLDAAPGTHRAGLCGSRAVRRRDSRRACGEQSGASGAGAAIRDPVRRSDVSRA